MALDLSEQRGKLVHEERLRQEQELREKLLTVEYQRKSEELEDARRFQLSLLPKTIPQHPAFDLAVFMKTATEVGGDYYDFHLTPEGVLTVAIGDATGHGAAAGTMVTVIKSLFSTYGSLSSPATFLSEAASAIRRMELGRMSMALMLVRIDGPNLTVSSAGMPPLLVRRAASGKVEEVAIDCLPLGTRVSIFEERSASVSSGDSLLLMSDGLPEQVDQDHEPFGYVAVQRAFAAHGGAAPQRIIDQLAEEGDRWARGEPLHDDVTLVALRVS
jgi:sigma-B regulation protein RsbU (phosphoserine phosphatase)